VIKHKAGYGCKTQKYCSSSSSSSSSTSGTIVKSRYMQSAEKTSLSKSNSLTNESTAVSLRPSSPKPSCVRPKVGTPPRRSVAPQALATSMMYETTPSLLQSTISEGHCFRPDWDLSVIKEPDRKPEDEKRDTEMKTFLLAYLTAKMESNTMKLEAEAEARILHAMEEEEALYNEVQEKKRQYLLAEKNRLRHELLDLQIAALTPVAETAEQFTKDYKSFAAAVDTTRHELPVKNIYIDGDRREFLGCSKILKSYYKQHKLQELSSLVSRQKINVQVATEEEQLGTERVRKLFCP
uniref:Uncharacterized protein n=1 Tax=Monopterus albus TaxID=43700 RepID=A0A3Q3R711_MONAL